MPRSLPARHTHRYSPAAYRSLPLHHRLPLRATTFSFWNATFATRYTGGERLPAFQRVLAHNASPAPSPPLQRLTVPLARLLLASPRLSPSSTYSRRAALAAILPYRRPPAFASVIAALALLRLLYATGGSG